MVRTARKTYSRDDHYKARPFGVERHSIDLYLQEFYVTKQTEGVAVATLTSYKNEFTLFARWLKKEKISENPSEWTPATIRNYILHLQTRRGRNVSNVSAMTVKSYMSRLLVFLRWLHQEQYTSINLADHIKRPRAQKKKVHPFTTFEVRALLEAVASEPRNGLRDLAILSLLLDTGIRASEFCGIKESDVLWDQCLVKVLGKGNKERVVPFSPTCKARMLAYLNGSNKRYTDRADTLFQTEEGWAMTPQTLLHMITRAAKRAGVENAHPHRFRHTFAVSFLRNGGNALVLQRFLGHTTLAMTNEYVELVTNDLSHAHLSASPLENL